MSCESLWHVWHRTLLHDIGRTLIGGGVGGAQNCDADASECGCKSFDGDANNGKESLGEDAGGVAWRGGVREFGEDEAAEGESDGEGRGNEGVDRGPVSNFG